MKTMIGIKTLLGWGLLVAIPTIGGAVGYTNYQFDSIQSDKVDTLQRLAIVETQSRQYKDDIKDVRDDIKDINTKLDVLLSKSK